MPAVTLALGAMWAPWHPADAAVVNLLPSVSRAQICPGGEERCWPLSISEQKHQLPGWGPAGRADLPVDTGTRLHLRLPPGSALAVAFSAENAHLSVRVTAEDGTEMSRDVASRRRRWQGAKIDLTQFSDQVVRLTFRADRAPGTEGKDASCHLARVLLRTRGRPAQRPALLPRPSAASPPNVLLYVIDTLRADHLGCYGYPRPTTPRIDRLAGEAVLFTNAIAQSSWTLPSTASILTGLDPPRHGALSRERAVRPNIPTLASVLAANGYRTAGFVTNYLASAAFGQGQGFASFRFYREDAARRAGVYLPSHALARRVIHWLRHPRPGPFFLYVHATDPHWPYLPPPRHAKPFLAPGTTRGDVRRVVDSYRPYFLGNDHFGSRGADLPAKGVPVLRDLYDGDIRSADEGLGLLLDELDRLGLRDHTMIVVTSDHGEEFLEHGGLAHAQTLHDEVLHVPLVVRLPGGVGAGTRVAHMVQHVDLMPSILDAAGIVAPPGLDGTSVLGSAPTASEEVLSFLTNGAIEETSLTSPAWKVVHHASRFAKRPFELYDRTRDPGENAPISDVSSVALGYGKTRLLSLPAPLHGPHVDPRTLDRLSALGYVER